MPNRTRTLKPHYYPPYGRMIKEWEDEIDHKPPGDWLNNVDWTQWRDGMSTLLSFVLWPRYSKLKQTWDGPATKTMHKLTSIDFEMLQILRPMLDGFARPPVDQMRQKDLFILEDVKTDPQTGLKLSDRGPDLTLGKYLSGKVEPQILDALVKGYLSGVNAKAGNVDLEIKIDMQRPRAYQMGPLLNQDWFTHQDARTAVTPSMISGHCVESLMGGIATFYSADRLGVSADAIAVLAQHTVDVGDRRVMAGVHYPSDNVSSWLTGMLLCSQVCDDNRGREWAWNAITTHSDVYKIVLSASNGNSPYKLPLDLLSAVGRGEIGTLPQAMSYARQRLMSRTRSTRKKGRVVKRPGRKARPAKTTHRVRR